MSRELVAKGQQVARFEGNAVKKRLLTLLDYDYRRLPYRVASSIQSDLSKFTWSDENYLYHGTGNPQAPIATEGIETLDAIARFLPNPYYRGDLSFYPIKKGAVSHSNFTLQPLQLDEGYLEFLFDVVVGTLGVYPGIDGIELWRRCGDVTTRIESIEESYGVRKPAAGVYQIFMDMLNLYPELAPMKVTSGLAIGDTIYAGLEPEPLSHDVIPRHIVPHISPDRDKARDFFKMVCPDEDSRHNLLLATVYPYFKRSNEKFFLLKGAGGTGKSRYMEHFPVLLGEKYHAIDLANLCATGHVRDSAIASLQSKLILHAPDTKMSISDKFVNELKRIATADRMVGRKIGTDNFSFKPSGVLFIDTNEHVNLDDSDAIMRRRVGIMFAPRGFTRTEFEPYFTWVSSLKGAVSIFLYAYSYFTEECGARFEWNRIDVNDEGAELSDELDELAARMMSDYLLNGEAYVTPDVFDNTSGEERARFVSKYGLARRTKRLGGRVARIWAVDDHDLFKRRMIEEGF